ncbi:class E sortase [Candidatus Curtissbacteria bacterium]|nr:class E sortase [Candidatus Curtissbacteria bacterium]
MALAVYVKAPPKKPKNPKTERYFYIGIISVGLGAIIFSILPFFIWQISILPRLSAKVENIPVPKAEVLSATTVLSQNVQVVQDADGFSYFTTTSSAKTSTSSANLTRPEDFSLSIPKLKIDNAQVVVDTTKFDNHLGHFPGTAIPGEVGNSFITGHSVLPQFADVKNYRAIFTNLSDLEIGDDVTATVDNKTYHYIVQYSKVVDPKDTSVLLPLSPNGHNLTLMSCVPPGTSSKRLIVITSLI